MSSTLRIAVTALAFSIAAPALAAPAAPAWTAYSSEQFMQAQAMGKTIVVDVHADWCPTCKAQAPILDKLRSEPALSKAMFVRVDFDNDKMFLKQHRIARQSTVVVFKGKRETARSVGETRPERLRAAVLNGAR